MADFLKVGPFPFAVQVDTARADVLEFNRARRTANASLVLSRIAAPSTWSCSSTPLKPDDLIAWRELILGRGMKVNFSATATHYANTGHFPTTANDVGLSTFVKYGSRSAQLVVGSGELGYLPFPVAAPWSVSYWRSTNGTTWMHVVIRSDGAKWADGSRNDSLSTPEFSAGSDYRFTEVTSVTNLWIDDVFLLRALFPLEWPALIYGYGAALFPNHPLVELSGDFIEANRVTVNAYGHALGSSPFPGYIGGTLFQNLARLEVEFEEVI